MKTGQGL